METGAYLVQGKLDDVAESAGALASGAVGMKWASKSEATTVQTVITSRAVVQSVWVTTRRETRPIARWARAQIRVPFTAETKLANSVLTDWVRRNPVVSNREIGVSAKRASTSRGRGVGGGTRHSV